MNKELDCWTFKKAIKDIDFLVILYKMKENAFDISLNKQYIYILMRIFLSISGSDNNP
jgi:hypothetical protein